MFFVRFGVPPVMLGAQRGHVSGEQFVLPHLGEQPGLLAVGVWMQKRSERPAGIRGGRQIVVPEGDLEGITAVDDGVVFGVEFGDHRDVAAPAVAAHRYQPRRRGRDPTGSPGRAAARER